MDRRSFLKNISILTALSILAPEVFAAYVERFKIPKGKKKAFFQLRNELGYRPYNTDLVNTLLKFNKIIKTSAYQDPQMKNLLIFLFVNTRNKEMSERLKKEIWEPMIQPQEEIDEYYRLLKENKPTGKIRLINQDRELKKYREKFYTSFESLMFFRLAGMTEKEKIMRDEIESKENLFNPGGEKEIYYKILYYIAVGDIEEAEYTFSTVEKKIENRIIQERRKNREKIFREKRKRVKRHVKKKELSFDKGKMFLAYISGLGSFIYRDRDEDLARKYAKFSKELAKGHEPWFYHYQMYANLIIYEEFDKAINYLMTVKENDPYTGIDEELFAIYSLSAEKNYKIRDYRNAWLSAKSGILIGMNLDYKKYYKTVIGLKKILKGSAIKYIKVLVKTNDRELAQAILDETNRVIKLSRSK